MVTDTFDIERIISDNMKNKYEYELSNLPNNSMLNSNNISFHITINTDSLLQDWRDNKITYNQLLIESDKKLFDSYYMLNIKNLFSKTPILKLYINDFYKSTYSANDVIMSFDSGYYTIMNGNFYITSSYKGIIYFYDLKNYKLKKKIKINSKYSSLGSISEKIYINDTNAISKIHKTLDARYGTGTIDKIFFYKNQYYVILSHSMKNIEGYKNYNVGEQASFSVFIYDENFENPQEYYFGANTYVSRNSFISEEGLWIQRKTEKITKENYGTQTFDLLKFN